MELESCPYGFADGEILSYRATRAALFVEFRFWNERKAVFEFRNPVLVHDVGAVGATISTADSRSSSQLISKMLDLVYVTRPDTAPWKHFRFHDLDDRPVFEVIAERLAIELERGASDVARSNDAPGA